MMKVITNNFLLQQWVRLQGWQKILSAMIGGIIVGFVFGPQALYLKPIGTLFINALHMIIVPVVFTAIVCAILSMNNLRKMRRVAIKTLSLYLLSMTIATIIGLLTAVMIAPGVGLTLHLSPGEVNVGHIPTFVEEVVNMIPENPFSAFASGNILQILVFAIFIGVAINLAGEAGEPVRTFFQSLSTVVFKLTGIVIGFAPLGIFALMACTAGEFGVNAFLPLMKLIMTNYLAYLLLFILFYSVALLCIVRVNPLQFFKGIREALLFSFSSSSSAATLPISMRCAQEKLGIPKDMAGFLLPLGISLNMNGLAIYLSVATVFAANIYGIELHFTQYLTLVMTIVLTSMGAAGIPGAAIVVMGAAMTAVGMPLGSIPLIASVDRIIDMGATTTNVVGDLFTATMITKSEKELDKTVYQTSPDAFINPVVNES